MESEITPRIFPEPRTARVMVTLGKSTTPPVEDEDDIIDFFKLVSNSAMLLLPSLKSTARTSPSPSNTYTLDTSFAAGHAFTSFFSDAIFSTTSLLATPVINIENFPFSYDAPKLRNFTSATNALRSLITLATPLLPPHGNISKKLATFSTHAISFGYDWNKVLVALFDAVPLPLPLLLLPLLLLLLLLPNSIPPPAS